MKIICAGDSITGQSDLFLYLKWSHILECMLEARRGAGTDTVLNAGVGGNTTAQLAARLEDDVIVPAPDVVVLLIGGNDAASIDRAVTAGNLDGIAARIIDAGARLLMLQYHVLPDPGSPGNAWTHLPDNNDLIAATGMKRNAPVLAMGPLMEGALATYRRQELVDPDDGVHLNPAGELVYARGVFVKMDELGWL